MKLWPWGGPAGAGGPRGVRGEELACRYLEARGFTVVARNFRCRGGELDVVAREGNVTVFVEVKERGDASRGAGHEAVTPEKRRRVVRAARVYAAARGLSEAPLRFDVISIDWSRGRPDVRHDRGAFGVDDD
jgi:putative endonuclease